MVYAIGKPVENSVPIGIKIMDILNQKIKIRVNNFNYSHFSRLGYSVKLNEYIWIKAKELPVGSGTKILVKCSYCGDIFKKSYRRFLETKDRLCCSNVECKTKKITETSLKKYGHTCSLRNPEVQKKSIDKNRKNLGVDYPFQNKDILRKCRENSIKNNGENFRKIYGKTSKFQIRLHKIYGGILNYNEFPYLLDIFFEKEKVYLEYDGSGHRLSVKLGRISEKNFLKNEEIRENYLKVLGYKQFRIIRNKERSKIEDKNLIWIKDRAFDILLNKGYGVYTFNLDTGTESFRN